MSTGDAQPAGGWVCCFGHGRRAPLARWQGLGLGRRAGGPHAHDDRALRGLARAHAHYRASLDALGGRFPWLGSAPSAALLEATREAWSRDGARLVEGDRRVEVARAHVSDPPALLDVLRRSLPDATTAQLRDGVVKAWARARIAALEARTPALTQRDAPTPWGGDDAAAQALTVRHDRAMALSAQRVLARLDEAAVLRVAPAVKGRRRTVDQASREAMLKECRKQRSVMPLRTFVRRFGDEGLGGGEAQTTGRRCHSSPPAGQSEIHSASLENTTSIVVTTLTS